MNALEILNALKRNRSTAMLWINHDRRQAAFHPGGAASYCDPVDYAEAKMARTDPALIIIDITDGETLTA